MTAAAILAETAAGLRMALVLLAVMSSLAWCRSAAEASAADRFKARAWLLMALAIILYSPAHTAGLLGRPPVPVLSRGLDVVGTSLACASFVYLLAARGFRRGLTEARVHRGMLANLAVIIGIVGAAWISR